MRRLRLFALAAAAIAAAFPALAECRGDDFLARLEATHPELAARLAAADSQPYARGRFWLAEREGRSGILFGTFHSPDPAVATLPPGLAEAIAGARRVVVEALPEEQQRLQQLMAANPAMFLSTGGPTLDRLLSPEELEGLARVIGAYGMPMQVAVQMQPWFLNMLMATPPCLMADMAAGRPMLDERVIAAAQAAGVPVEGLERIEDALRIYRDAPAAWQLQLLRLNIALSHLSDELMVAGQRLYLAEEIWRIWMLNEVLVEALGLQEELGPLVADFYRRALVARNRAWLPGIRRALEAGGAVIAVGALHLAGPDSIQAMLEGEGWRFTRLGPDGRPHAADPAPASEPPAQKKNR